MPRNIDVLNPSTYSVVTIIFPNVFNAHFSYISLMYIVPRILYLFVCLSEYAISSISLSKQIQKRGEHAINTQGSRSLLFFKISIIWKFLLLSILLYKRNLNIYSRYLPIYKLLFINIIIKSVFYWKRE